MKHRTAAGVTTSALIIFIAVSLLLFEVVIGAPRNAPGKFDRAGLQGSGQAHMFPVNTGTRVAIVASVPNSDNHEAWAIAKSSARIPGWPGEKDGGQTIFLKYTRGSGWRTMGPPVAADGSTRNPNLTAISLAANGEGWAVGDDGVLVQRDQDRWVVREQAKTSDGDPIDAVLLSVSVGNSGGSTFGYALGQGSVVLRLDNGRWHSEFLPSPPGGSSYDLVAISAVGPDEAWAAGADGGAVLVFRRTGAGWSRILTGSDSGEAFFDDRGVRRVEGMSPPVSSTRAAAVSASGAGAWVGGTIVPVTDPKAALGDPAGDVTRPFAIFFPGTGADVETYCPDEYALNNDGKAVTNSVCENALPRAGFGISAMHAFDNGELFAGGLGVFHFKDGEWFREPNPIGFVSSMGFTSPSEGWVAGTGNTYGAKSSVSSIGTLAHWSKSTPPNRKARWPLPPSDPSTLLSYPLESVALAPDRSGRAVAVGQNGATYIYSPEVGWESAPLITRLPLHGAAWPASNLAWAVGAQGTILYFDGSSWFPHPQSGRLVSASIFDVAFSSPARGYAVGANGLILRYDGSKWSKDPASGKLVADDLYAIDVAGSDFVAAGANGTVLVNRGGTWDRETGVLEMVTRGGVRPALFAVDGLSDGTVLIGGELSTLLRREDNRWTTDVEGTRVPPEGTVLAIGARRRSGRLEMFLSLSYERSKYAGETPSAVTGFLLYGDDNGWRDLDNSVRLTAYPSLEASGPADPVLSIAVEGDAAWAVGGTGPGNDDGQGHVAAFGTGSIYRVALSGNPAPTGNTVVPSLETDSDVITFAFFGESSCGRGLCSSTMGSGTKADNVASRIQDEVNELSRLPGGPRFVVFGGNMRRIGIPEEIGEFKKTMRGFRIPVFAALGNTDLFTDLTSVALDQVPDQDGNVTRVREQFPDPSDASFYLKAFNDMPQPWGKAHPPRGVVPVNIGDSPRSDSARTHYAFDYVEGGRRLRIIVLDSAGTRMTNSLNTQNPPQDQVLWLESVLRDGRDKGAQSIVVMNRPYQNPLEVGLDAQPHPDAQVQTAISVSGLYASAVLSSYFRANALDVLQVSGVASTLPVYIFGGGGAPLEASLTKPPNPGMGYYHSYQLISVNFSPQRRIPPLGRAEIYARSYPVVDSVAMTAVDGVVVRGGNTLRFTGSGRVVDGGGPGDPFQSRASVVPLDLTSAGVCPPDPADNNRPKCSRLAGGPIGPAFYYASDNPEIGTFVRPSFVDPRLPLLDAATGRPIPDATSGLFCGFKAGQTFVNLVSGFHRARKQVTVTGGSGLCVRDPVPDLVREIERRSPLLAPLERAESRPFLVFPPGVEIPPVGIVIPPFVPILAPAPPAAGGYAKREQHKEATEEQGSDFTALSNETRVELGLSRPTRRMVPSNTKAGWGSGQKGKVGLLSDPLMATATALTLAFSLALSLGVVWRWRARAFDPSAQFARATRNRR